MSLPSSITCTDETEIGFTLPGQENLMCGHHRILSSLPRQCSRVKVLRSFTSTSRVAFRPVTEGEGKEQREGNSGRSAPKDPTFAVWKETIGKQYEKPHRPCNWLGGKVVEFVSVCISIPTRSLTPPQSHSIRSAFPAKPILQASNPGFRCSSKYYI